MKLLTKPELISSIKSVESGSLFIEPLLEDSQIDDVSVDLRLGYDFLVSILTRKPFISISPEPLHLHRGIESYFQETRRDVGDRFVLYPNQVVLTTTLEYISLPNNVYADILSRSSYTRLGIHINTMVQPGFKGCASLELFNSGNNAIELVVGSRICQARFYEIDGEGAYIKEDNLRKYYGNVRPTASKADKDIDLNKLSKMYNSSRNNLTSN